MKGVRIGLRRKIFDGDRILILLLPSVASKEKIVKNDS